MIGSVTDLGDQTIIVTGANSGIGFAATKTFVSKGATVIMACRNMKRGRDAREKLEADDPRGRLDVMHCDLASLESIDDFANSYHDRYDALHILCNNAGVMAIPRLETDDGFEMQIGVNHLGHYALTGKLFDVLSRTPGETRVVTQSSKMHERVNTIDFADLHSRTSYDKWTAYSRSKLANVLFARELHRRSEDTPTAPKSVACEPGFVATNLHQRGPELTGNHVQAIFWKTVTRVGGQSPTAGARTVLFGALSPDITGGEYVRPSGLMKLRGAPTITTPSETARDPELARKLWEVSVEQTGVTFDFQEVGSESVSD